jgi:CRP-like cAMP-binding protein
LRKSDIPTVYGAVLVKQVSSPVPLAKFTDDDGNAIHNQLLLSLPREEWKQVRPKLELVRLNLHHLLYEVRDTVKSAYFINNGMISVLAVQPDGDSIEVGLIGNEGFVGLPLLVGFRSSPSRFITQAAGSAYRCGADAIKQLFPRCPVLTQLLHRYGQQLAMQTTQIAACNRLHEVQERLARWILMTDDRVGSKSLPLTQEFLSQMLGTRRPSVTLASGILQKAGLISHSRGSITVLNRAKLEEAACDCYAIVQRQLKEWESETK